MQLHLDGSNSINAPMAKVFSLLTDARFIARNLQDAEDVRVLDESVLEAKLKVRVALVSSTQNVRLTIADRQPPSKAKLLVDGSGSGSSMKVVSEFTLSGGSPTTMAWAADADVTGVMAGLGSTILRGFAAKKVAEIFDGITKAMEREASAPG